MVDVQTVSVAIASASVVAGVIYYVWQIRHQTKIRQTDLVMRLYSDFGRRDFLEANRRIMVDASRDYNAFLKEYGWTDVIQVGTFYEGIGVLLKRKLVDLELVDDLFSEPIRTLWGFMKPIIESDRKRLNQPRIFESFEYLYNEMQKIESVR